MPDSRRPDSMMPSGATSTCPIDNASYRVYFEESGSGDVGLLLPAYRRRGWPPVAACPGRRRPASEVPSRSLRPSLPRQVLPPTSKPWWREEYRLTRDFLMAVPIALSRALDFHRPVYMGSSIGGHLAVIWPCATPASSAPVSASRRPPHTPGGFIDEFHHPEIGNDFKAHLMYGMMAPTSPDAYRRETAWVYSQGAPAVLQGRPLLLLHRPRCPQQRSRHRHRRLLRGHPERRIRLERHAEAGAELAALIPAPGTRPWQVLATFP